MTTGLILLFSTVTYANPLALSAVEQRELNKEVNDDAKQPNGLKNILLVPLRIYSTVLSSFDGDRCPSYPSCSLYSRQAIHKHGVLTGWWLTVDRLIHERTEIHQAELIHLPDGRERVYDPLEINDFWITR